MSHDEVKVSSDLIRWLKLLTLPGSVKAVVGTIMVVAAASPKPRLPGESGGQALIKALDEDFLLSPAQRLYFTQDLAFFLRGLIEATE
jgi:hypothetical protein